MTDLGLLTNQERLIQALLVRLGGEVEIGVHELRQHETILLRPTHDGVHLSLPNRTM